MSNTNDHSQRAHSNLGPSAAHRWMECPGSVQSEIKFYEKHPGKRNESSIHSREGTMAHELCESLVEDLDFDIEDWEATVDNPEEFNLVEMMRHCLQYREYVLDQIEDPENDIVLSESRMKMPQIHRNAYGTGDNLVIHPLSKSVDVTDFKYGKGQYVEVKNNKQGLMYAVGARNECIDKYGFEPEQYTIRIFQPRTDPVNINEWTISKRRLNEFIEEAAVAAILTESPWEEVVFNPGEKQCYWCAANGDCKPLDDFMTEFRMSMLGELPDLETATEEAKSNNLTPKRKGELLRMFPLLERYIAAVRTAAMNDALDNTPPEGFKLVAGRNSYKCEDEEGLAFLVGDKAFKPKETKSMSALKKDLGAAQFRDLGVEDMFSVQAGKPTLAKESDKRPAIIPEQQALDALDDLPE